MSNNRAGSSRGRTKIVATVGPACHGEEKLTALIEAGADVFRLNMAHGELAEHEATLEAIRRVSRKLWRPIGVLADLAGPKIRLGDRYGGQQECVEGAELRLVRGDVSPGPGVLVSEYDRLMDELARGDRVVLADGAVRLTVEDCSEQAVRFRVVQSGLVRSRQGINLPGVKVGLPAMSEEDRAHAVWAAEHGIDFVGLSFVRAPDEVRELKALLRSHNSKALVIAKIEKQEALDRLEEIVAAADGVMVARGDLGVENDVAGMPVAQQQIVATCNRYQKQVIIATQMIESMQHSGHP